MSAHVSVRSYERKKWFLVRRTKDFTVREKVRVCAEETVTRGAVVVTIFDAVAAGMVTVACTDVTVSVAVVVVVSYIVLAE